MTTKFELTIFCKIICLILMFSSTGFGHAGNLYINEFLARNNSVNSDNHNEYDDWIELYNASDSTIDIAGYFITDDLQEPTKWQISNNSSLTSIQPGGFLLLWADDDTAQGDLHLGFKLSGGGEQIGLFAPDGRTVIDSLSFGPQEADISFGRYPDGAQTWLFFPEPTPEDSNHTEGISNKASAPEFSSEAGFYNYPFELTLSSENDTAIYYTQDGSEPDVQSERYENPINITHTTIIRARVIIDGYLPSDIISRSFIFDDSLHLAVVSLITDPENLWGPKGILDHRSADWERPVHIEFFNESFNLGFRLNGGIKIHAPDSRPQQSFRIYAKKKYGQDMIEYPLFGQKNLNKFKVLVLRNGGNDGMQLKDGTHLRDPMMHVLFAALGHEEAMAGYRPVNVFLNGAYWGIYNLRERQDRHYIAGNFGYDDDIDLLERTFGYPGNRCAIEGDWDNYLALRDFIRDNDLSETEPYNYTVSQMDIDNFLDYWIIEVFGGNYDWLSNNVKYWRAREANAKWRWLLWDTDHTLGLPFYAEGMHVGNPEWNTLDYSTGTEGQRTYDGNNNIHIRGLLDNPQFRINFINRFADLLNSSFADTCTIPMFRKIKSVIEPDAKRQLQRWGPNDVADWEHNISIIEDYLHRRPAIVREHIREKFALDGDYKISLQIEPADCGSILLNSIKITGSSWQGIYYKNIPIKVEAKPYRGYVFSRWQMGTTQNDTASLVLTPDSALSLTAHFVLDTIPGVIINEINYNSNDSFDSDDWVEFYNPKRFAIDMSGWVFKDNNDNHSFTFPQNTFIDSMNYIVLCKDMEKFGKLFPDVDNCIGSFGGDNGFGLSGSGELIRIYNKNGELIDKVVYDDRLPWPEEADGAGYTLELTDPDMDNSVAKNWAASSKIGGTPGRKNSTYTALQNVQEHNPVTYQLMQNYPNPFNAQTTIKYRLPKASHVQLIVYNLLGEKICSLVDENKPAGTFKATFNANRFPSGLYFFILKCADGTSLSRKGILIK